jgi:5-methylcytosine-specific restriction endonuclease McrA
MKANGRVTQGLCECGNKQAMIGLNKNGLKVYRKICGSCHKVGRRNKKPLCERCGFIAKDLCQIDIDHIDGNSNNNDLSNLANICSNCHRLKTKLFDQWTPEKWRNSGN